MFKARVEKSEGFGLVPARSEHHFLVTIPPHKKDDVLISEHFTWEESEARRELSFALGQADNKMRVILPRQKWEAIADPVKAEFNQRLRHLGLKSGQWLIKSTKDGQTPIARLFGKELVLLAWAIEEADPALIPIALKNWLGLAPEERWWLFTMTNAATGHAISGRGKGWRKAVRYALTENPVSDYRPETIELPLFKLREDEAVWARTTISLTNGGSQK
ncbi:MAG: DUF3780 domain-containing protein [Aphanocapsa sp. GSE-SYN-MK-11-07L]|jgi:hypothetical protein|nr:DUF3780 domain-containing protein [Aphanocapsa sp. GSE-SYN-MK-11-07L]